MHWNFVEDHLSFNVCLIAKIAFIEEPTKNQIVRVSVNFYEPLGVLSPFIVLFELLMQRVWETVHSVLQALGLEELKKTSMLLTPSGRHTNPVLRCENYSKLGQLLRATAYVSQFIKSIKTEGRSSRYK